VSSSSSWYREALLEVLLCVESVNPVVFLAVEPPIVTMCGVVAMSSACERDLFLPRLVFVAAPTREWLDGQVSYVRIMPTLRRDRCWLLRE
jgi:hypothetical protein